MVVGGRGVLTDIGGEKWETVHEWLARILCGEKILLSSSCQPLDCGVYAADFGNCEGSSESPCNLLGVEALRFLFRTLELWPECQKLVEAKTPPRRRCIRRSLAV